MKLLTFLILLMNLAFVDVQANDSEMSLGAGVSVGAEDSGFHIEADGQNDKMGTNLKIGKRGDTIIMEGQPMYFKFKDHFRAGYDFDTDELHSVSGIFVGYDQDLLGGELSVKGTVGGGQLRVPGEITLPEGFVTDVQSAAKSISAQYSKDMDDKNSFSVKGVYKSLDLKNGQVVGEANVYSLNGEYRYKVSKNTELYAGINADRVEGKMDGINNYTGRLGYEAYNVTANAGARVYLE